MFQTVAQFFKKQNTCNPFQKKEQIEQMCHSIDISSNADLFYPPGTPVVILKPCMSFISSLSAYKTWSEITCIERYYFTCHFLNKKLNSMIFQLKKFEVNLCSLNCKTVSILVQVYSVSKPVHWQALVKENSSLIKLRSFSHFEILFMTICSMM